MRTAHLKQALEQTKRLVASRKAAAALDELVAAAGLDERTVDALFDSHYGATFTRGRYAGSVAETGLEISLHTAMRDLSDLVKAVLLTATGQKRGLGRARQHLDPCE